MLYFIHAVHTHTHDCTRIIHVNIDRYIIIVHNVQYIMGCKHYNELCIYAWIKR